MSTHNWDTRRQRKAQMLLQPLFEADGHEKRGVWAKRSVWADLGCGDGVFTQLLAQWLEPGSTIYAVDKDGSALRRLKRTMPAIDTGVSVHPLRADFTGPLALPPLNGMLLAHSLHFVRHKQPVLAQLIQLLAPAARVIIIEYNAQRGNYAVPHPIAAEACLDLMRTVGLADAQILSRVPSSFLGEMYAATAQYVKQEGP